MAEILFLFITQPEEICETKKIFEWILLFADGFPGCTIFISMATFPIWMIFFFQKKTPDLISLKKIFCHLLPRKQ